MQSILYRMEGLKDISKSIDTCLLNIMKAEDGIYGNKRHVQYQLDKIAKSERILRKYRHYLACNEELLVQSRNELYRLHSKHQSQFTSGQLEIYKRKFPIDSYQ
jgi:hypothetical protein